MPFPNKATQWKPGERPKGAGKPKGSKHISTWIQELLNDEEFKGLVRDGMVIKEYKGAPLKAMIQAQVRLAINGDTKAFEALAKHGWKQEVDVTSGGNPLPTPILGSIHVPADNSAEESNGTQQAD